MPSSDGFVLAWEHIRSGYELQLEELAIEPGEVCWNNHFLWERDSHLSLHVDAGNGRRYWRGGRHAHYLDDKPSALIIVRERLGYIAWELLREGVGRCGYGCT